MSSKSSSPPLTAIMLAALRLLADEQLVLARSALEAISTSLNSDAAMAIRCLAHIDFQELQYARALERLQQAHRDFGPDHKVLTQMAEVLMQLGDYDQAIEYGQQALELNAKDQVLELHVANWMSSRSRDPASIRKSYENWCHQYLDPLIENTPPLHVKDRRANKLLKIGYVSGDLKNHAVRYFIEPYLKLHDRKNYEVHAFMTTQGDAITEILKEHVEHWHDVQALPEQILWQQIREMDIDILVDLSGHTKGDRLGVFARRAAPVQVTWWGFVQTLGMQAMDYRLTDTLACPTGTDPHYTETLCRMQCLTAYEPPLNCEALYESPCKKNGYVTMVSLNHSRKISNEALEIWRQILEKNPNCGLIIVSSEKSQEGADALFLPRLHALNMCMERISIVPRLTMLEFMSLASVADFSLDSMPISGGVTTFHALWMGLPVLTLKPEQPIALQSYSANILEMVGLHECVAENAEQYIAKASTWINDTTDLSNLRAKCRPGLLRSPFMDHVGRVRELEDQFRNLWSNFLSTT